MQEEFVSFCACHGTILGVRTQAANFVYFDRKKGIRISAVCARTKKREYAHKVSLFEHKDIFAQEAWRCAHPDSAFAQKIVNSHTRPA